MPEPLEQRRERVRGQRHPAGAHRAERRADPHAHAVARECGGLAVLVDPHTERLGRGLQAPHEPRRVDQRAPAPVPHAALVGGRVDLGPHLVLVEPHDVVTELLQLLEVVAQLVEITLGVVRGGHADLAGALVVAVDPVARDRRLDLVEVVLAEAFQHLDLVGPPRLRVGDAVGEAGVHEAAVAATRGRPDRACLEQHHVLAGVALLGLDRGPQPGVAAADDAQVAVLGAHQCAVRVGDVDVLVPIRRLLGVGDRVEMSLVVLARVEGHALTYLAARVEPRNVSRMGLLAWIAIGLLAGLAARWIVKDDRAGCIYTLVVGVLGALIGGALMSAIDERGVDEFSLRSLVVAILGAVLLLLILQAIAGRRRIGRR